MDTPAAAADKGKGQALSLLASERPRNVGWVGAGALLFGDWGTSRLYVLGLAFLVGGRSAFWLILAMSLLILAVGWAYTQICRVYPDGGGVYTAGKRRARILGVIGALLLFADYTVTASLSSIEAFHYFGLESHPKTQHVQPETFGPPTPLEEPDRMTGVERDVAEGMGELAGAPVPVKTQTTPPDAGDDLRIPKVTIGSEQPPVFTWPPGPALCAIIAIALIGVFNLMGPKHTAAFAVFAAGGMVAITLLVCIAALPQIDWATIDLGTIFHPPADLWRGFVFIVLALSGVEAIANLTGVMKKPVYVTSRKSIWLVATEVAIFNLILCVAMVALSAGVEGLPTMGREEHKEDMLAFMAGAYIGPWGEWPVRIVGGLLLLSAANTAVNGIMSILYVMSRDSEMPSVFQKLNGFGAPWVASIVAALVPCVVLIFAHDLETLAALYAIGVVGAVALDTSLLTIHPRLRRMWRKIAMGGLALFLVVIWITLATQKLPALIFVTLVMVIGLSLRQLTVWAKNRRPRVSLLRQAIRDQLTPEALVGKKLLLATAGGAQLAENAIMMAKAQEAALVVCFVREVALNYRVEAENRLTLDTDPAAETLFTDFLELGHKHGVTIIPVYDTGHSAPELIAEMAAINAVDRVLIGSSRRGALHHIIKGSFQRRIEALLPRDIPVQVLSAKMEPVDDAAAAQDEPAKPVEQEQ